MATVQKAIMGQHEQRSIHNFFVRHGCRSPEDCAQPESLATMQPSTPSTPGPDGVDPSASHSPLWMAADESVRRKRRRTTPTEVAEAAGHTPGSSPAVAVGVVVNSEGPPLVPDNLALSPVNAAEDRSGNSRYSLRAATNLGTPKYVFDNPFQSDVPKNKRKVLQLNPNGKLLDSPIKRGDTGLQEPSKDVKRRDRPRKRPGAKSERLSRLVIIRYGSETLPRRERLGQEIHEIMHGHTTYNLLKRRAEKVQGPQELSKPTHPFFLARQLANKAEDAGVRKDISTQEGANATADRQELPNPRPFPVTGRLKPISAPKPITKPKRLDDPIEPIWPPCGMIHIQDNEAHDNVECQQVSFESKKAKGLEAKVPEAESVLAAIARSIRGDCSRVKYSTDTPLRGRRRILKTGDEFHGIVVERFAWNPTKEPSENNSTPIKATHPAVTNLLSEIETSRSAFEKGCYDELPWVQKYAPDTALKVLQIGQETLVLRNWLQKLTVTAVNTTINKPDLQPSKASRMEVGKRKKRKRAKDLDDFIVSSGDEEVELDEVPREEDDEDELAGGVTVPKRTVVRRNGLLSADKASRESPPASNTILLSGPSGCGKTAAVYAVASELGFEVFEVNAGSRRSARDVVERVGDMAQNHLVQILNKTDGIAGAGAEEHDTPQGAEKQTSMGNFFKLKTIKGVPAEQKIAHPAYRDSEVQKPKPNQRQSLILLEEVDVLFSEDKQFWNGVLALISQSKRPIVMTCNDESLLPMDSLSLNAILRYRPPPPELAANYLSVLCANEGHIVDPKDILDLYVTTGKDLRATIMQLDYWCQMAVGSQKSGLDWIVDCPWSNRLGSSPDVPRIISLDTYIKGMGWLSRDMALEKNEGLEKRTRLVEDYFIQWDVSPVEWVESKVSPTCCRGGNTLEQLDQASFMSEMESVLDLLCPESNDYPTKDSLDVSAPPLPDKQRINYIEGYQFLQAEPVQDYSGFSNKLGATVGALFELMFSELAPEDYEQDIIQDIAQRTAGPASSKINLTTFEKSFSPITDVLEYSTPASGHRPLSFGHGISVISEDVAPYIRSIVAFDLRLEQERIQLSGPLSQGAKRPRTTRASRAAVEGGDKGMIRRERWFPMKLVPNQVMMTGGPSWENILLSQIQRGCVENTSETAEISESMSQCSNESMYKSAGEHVPVI